MMNEITSDSFNQDKKYASKEQVINNLHKMLDKQLTSVGDVLHSGQTFNQIEAKLKQLQVKLGTIKQDGSLIPSAPHRKKQHSLDQSQFSYLQGRKYWDSSNRPTRISEHNKFCSVKKNKSKQWSGKKLNFQEEYITNKKSTQKKKKKSVTKIKSEGNLFSNKVLRQVSPQSSALKQQKQPRSSSKSKQFTLSNNTTEKKHKGKEVQTKISSKNIKKSHLDKENYELRRKSVSNKKLISSAKTQKNLKRVGSSVKNMEKQGNVYNYGSSKNQRDMATSIQKRIFEFEKKKLAKELDGFKRKNQVLEKRVQALKGFQDEFLKLKSVFDKGKLKTRNK